TAICGNIVPLITLASTAVRRRKARFHKVKASAVLTRASQPTIAQPAALGCGGPERSSPTASNTSAPIAIDAAVITIGDATPSSASRRPSTEPAALVSKATTATVRPAAPTDPRLACPGAK